MNRYANVQYGKLGKYLRSKKGKAAFAASQANGDRFAKELIYKTELKPIIRKEIVNL